MSDSEGKQFLVEPCDLHKSQPNEQERAEALGRWMERKLFTCIACGRELKVARFHIRHERLLYGRSRHRWEISDFDYLDPAVVLHTFFEEGGIHLSCIRSALPYATWPDIEGEYSEKVKHNDPRDSKRTP